MVIFPESMSKVFSSFEIGYRPGELLGVALLHNIQLEEKVVFDESARVLLDDPDVAPKLYGTMHGARDFMRDTFGGDHPIGVRLTGRWAFLALKLDEYTLVAICAGGPYPRMVEKWLLRLAGLLTSRKYSMQ